MSEPEAGRWHGDEWRWTIGGAYSSTSRTTIAVIEEVKTSDQPFGFSRALEPETPSPSIPASIDLALAANGIEADSI